jgi:uncharacterized FlaG/YvyC family protein
MAENTIANIGQVDQQMRINSAYHISQAEPASAQAAREVQGQAASRIAAREASRDTQQAELKPSGTLPVTNNDVVLKFRVDDKTQAVTVFVVDRASDNVLRTIPADELGKMSAGDLLKIAA